MAKSIEVTEFKTVCLRIIDEVSRDGEPVTITERGRPVVVLSPAEAPKERGSIIGAMAGTVLRYDDPSLPAADVATWQAVRGE